MKDLKNDIIITNREKERERKRDKIEIEKKSRSQDQLLLIIGYRTHIVILLYLEINKREKMRYRV